MFYVARFTVNGLSPRIRNILIQRTRTARKINLKWRKLTLGRGKNPSPETIFSWILLPPSLSLVVHHTAHASSSSSLSSYRRILLRLASIY